MTYSLDISYFLKIIIINKNSSTHKTKAGSKIELGALHGVDVVFRNPRRGGHGQTTSELGLVHRQARRDRCRGLYVKLKCVFYMSIGMWSICQTAALVYLEL